jgi:hypothetical protein
MSDVFVSYKAEDRKRVKPLLHPLRPDPRFQTLIKRMNFPA